MKCAATGCRQQVPNGRLMCRAHWSRVSAPTKKAVWATYGGEGQLGAHVSAVIEAINEVSGAEEHDIDDELRALLSAEGWVRPREEDQP